MKLFPLFGGLAGVGLLMLALVNGLASRLDPIDRAAREASLYRAQQLDADLYAVDRLSGALLRLALPLALVILCVGSSVIVLLIAYRQLASWQSIRANKFIALAKAQATRQLASPANGQLLLAALLADRKTLPAPAVLQIEEVSYAEHHV